MSAQQKIYTVTLGCPKNRVDTEVMLGLLAEAGYQPTINVDEADFLLINTCGFIQPAVEEAISEILALAELKADRPELKLLVTGCLVQRYGLGLAEQLPEVDLFIGTDGFQDIVESLKAMATKQPTIQAVPHYVMDSSQPRILTTPAHRAYLKVSEGCSNSCSYCMIPGIRGPMRSRTINDLTIEAQELAQAEIKELTLVGQDLTAYGLDLGHNQANLPQLLQGLITNTDIPWLRLLYLYPTRVDKELLQLMAAEPRLLNYLDIPLQHVSEKVLKAMRRPFGSRNVHEVIGRIRAILPAAAIRTTFMVGFPGETEADVEEIASFMKEHRLNNVGIFKYCNEQGCQAEFFSDQLTEEVKEERYNYLMAIQAPISQSINKGMIGETLEVLVEGLSEETELLLEGRATFQAPEIDGCVYINDGNCSAGELVQVEITEALPYDLVGGIVKNS